MSTEPTPTPDSKSTTDPTPTTEIAARGRADPWAADGAGEPTLTAARAPRQFEPRSLARMRNLMDDDNAYCN